MTSDVHCYNYSIVTSDLCLYNRAESGHVKLARLLFYITPFNPNHFDFIFYLGGWNITSVTVCSVDILTIQIATEMVFAST